eukprot:2885245-Prymnesium_polylepis.1
MAVLLAAGCEATAADTTERRAHVVTVAAAWVESVVGSAAAGQVARVPEAVIVACGRTSTLDTCTCGSWRLHCCRTTRSRP